MHLQRGLLAMAIGCAAIPGSHCTSPRNETHAPATTPRRSNLTLDDRKAWKAVLGWPESCEEAFHGSRVGESAGVEFYPLGGGVSLVQVLCASGSYQPSFVFVRIDERDQAPVASVLTFPAYRSEDGVGVAKSESIELWGEPAVRVEQKELAVLSLARQTGDCGVWSLYAVGDNAPRLIETRARLPCPHSPGPPAVSESGRPPAGWTAIGE